MHLHHIPKATIDAVTFVQNKSRISLFCGAVLMNRLLVLCAALLSSTAAMAADFQVQAEQPAYVVESAVSFFVEGRLGAAIGAIDDLRFVNPVGTAFTSNATSGSNIILNGIDRNDVAWAGYVGAGAFVNESFFVRGSYRYFGDQNFTGSATFGGGTFNQDLKVSAHGLFVGLGGHVDLSDAFYLEGVLDIGVAMLRSEGRQGANLGLANAFPGESHVNFAAGAEILAGYRVTESMDLTLSASYHYLGNANTGTTGAPAPAGMQVGERLEANLGVATVMAGVRFNF